jgi:CHAT domain-containing protein
MENALAAVNALVGNRDASGELRTDDEDAHLLIAGAYDGFWAFVWQGQRLQVAYLSPTESDPAASAELRARLARCLETFLSDVSVPLLRVTLPAELAELDVHAMSVGGRALIERVPVAYTLEPSSSPKGDVGAGASADSVVVIGNPSGDLPRSEVEATEVAERFPGSQLLLGNQASRSALSSQLTNAHLLHFAGHGRAGGVDGTDSALMLSADQFLALGDVLALGHVPEFVVLSACSSGLSTDRGAGLSIGQAFVLAGAQAVIAAGRAISDSESERFTRALYDHLLGAEGSHTLPSGSHAWAAALRATALEFQGDPATDWASVRLLLP